ncbi:MAG: PQQ-binding-like beta-propeller repeat protein [Gemmatales bacterium]|nr:PQQ-binding-like beta-propeller repeat protein [Gemmatales bacterium]
MNQGASCAAQPAAGNAFWRKGLLSGLMLALLYGVAAVHGDDWPQWLGPQRDGVWREDGIVERFPPAGLKVLWRTPLGGGYAGPAVAGQRVLVTDWRKEPGAREQSNPFLRGDTPGHESVLCLEADSGRILWQYRYPARYRISYPAGPRCTPTVDGDRVYTLGAMGHLLCLELATGRVIWSKELPADYKCEVPLWGYAAHPLIDGNKLITLAGGEGSLVVALDKHSGKELWRALSAAEPGYCPPVIYDHAGRRQLIIWHPEAVESLDPETGQVYWRQPFRIRSGLSIPMPRKLGDLLFVTAFYDGPMMLRLDAHKPAASLLWRGKSNSEKKTDGLHSIIPTPVMKDGYIYGVCSYGQLRCLKAETGERLWETFAATTGDRPARWANAFLIPHRDRFFLFNEKGELILARLTPKGYEEISRTKVIEPTGVAMGRDVVWVHPAFAHRCMFVRNDKEILCVSLRAEDYR